MGPRNLLILFFSTVAVSLVILIIFFSLFFKNVNLDFNTRLPESAPDIGSRFNASSTMSPDSKADGLSRSTVNVPPDYKEPEANTQAGKEKEPKEDFIPNDVEIPPVSDDALLENDYPQPLPEKPLARPMEKTPLTEPYGNERPNTRSMPTAPTSRSNRAVEPRREAQPSSVPAPIEELPATEPDASGPPIPQ